MCSFQTPFNFLNEFANRNKGITFSFIFLAIETTKGGRILSQGEIWEYQGCRFHFTGLKRRLGCPEMLGPRCQMYNGAVCCAKQCPGNFFFSTRFKNKDSFYETIVSLSSDSKTTNFLFHLAFSFCY